MTTRLRNAATALLVALATSSNAADPASARGTATIAGERVTIAHAVAVQRDNAEGLLDSPNELRIALTDRELAPEQLRGIVFLPATTLAIDGKVRGLLVRVDPANRNRANVTVLAKPLQAGASLANVTLEATSGALPSVKITEDRVVGSIERSLPGEPPVAVAVTFSAPVLREPKVTEDLRGAAAQASAQVKTLQAAAKALSQGNRAAQASHMTAAARARQDQMFAQPGAPKGGELAKMLKQAGDEMTKELAKVQRVVVRGERAVVLAGDGAAHSMALESGAWKIDD